METEGENGSSFDKRVLVKQYVYFVANEEANSGAEATPYKLNVLVYSLYTCVKHLGSMKVSIWLVVARLQTLGLCACAGLWASFSLVLSTGCNKVLSGYILELIWFDVHELTDIFSIQTCTILSKKAFNTITGSISMNKIEDL